MESCDAKNADVSRAYRQVLGSLNYSSGGEDPQFYSAMNVLFAAEQDKDGATWQLVFDRLKVELTALAAEGGEI